MSCNDFYSKILMKAWLNTSSHGLSCMHWSSFVYSMQMRWNSMETIHNLKVSKNQQLSPPWLNIPKIQTCLQHTKLPIKSSLWGRSDSNDLLAHQMIAKLEPNAWIQALIKLEPEVLKDMSDLMEAACNWVISTLNLVLNCLREHCGNDVKQFCEKWVDGKGKLSISKFRSKCRTKCTTSSMSNESNKQDTWSEWLDIHKSQSKVIGWLVLYPFYQSVTRQ